jgi:hypothetical protein
MHRRIALPLFVLGRTGCMDDRRIDGGACRDANAAAVEIAVDRVQHLAT